MPNKREIKNPHFGKMNFKNAKVKFYGGYQCYEAKQNKIGQDQDSASFVKPYFL